MHSKPLLTLVVALLYVLALSAQGAAVEKTAKAVFTLTTYRADGSIIAVTHGAYYANAGEGIAAFKPFVGAARATIIDATGATADVESIMGANDMYDICRFTLTKAVGMPLQPYDGTATGEVWVPGYSTRKAAITPLHISSSEPFNDKYNYYIFDEEINEDIEGCPIVTADGRLLGLVQQAGTSYAIHSTDARYYGELTSTGLSSYDAVLQKTGIRTALPADHEQARLMLLTITAAHDSLRVVSTTNDYMARYPDDIDGYSTLATYEVEHGNYRRADDIFATAIKKAKDKDDAYYNYAKLIYNTIVFSSDTLSLAWTLADAASNISKALALRDIPLYQHLRAQILFTMGDYAAADDIFASLTTSDIANSDIYYERAQCRRALGATQEEVLALLDAAVAAAPVPLTVVAAPYILVRGMLHDEMDDYHAALADYNLYDSLMLNRADDKFYYTRALCEVKVRQYQQAINDFSHAVVVNPQEVTYLAELAALEVRVGKYEDALLACDLSFNVTRDYADIYLIQGLAYHGLNRHDEARAAWQRVVDLGDARGEAYLAKYSSK